MASNRRILPPDILRREKIQPTRDVIPLTEARLSKTDRRPVVEYDRKADAFTVTLGAGRLDFLAEEGTAIVSLICEALRIRGNKS